MNDCTLYGVLRIAQFITKIVDSSLPEVFLFFSGVGDGGC